MHILVAGREALFNVFGVLLAVEDGYNSEGGWDLEAEVPRMQGSFKSIEKPSSEDGIIGVMNVDDIKGDVLSS
jgi:hypothetical protein